MPLFFRVSITAGCFIAAAVASRSRFSTVIAKPEGANSASQASASTPGTPAWASVGKSGKYGDRLGEATAMARSRPDWIGCSTVGARRETSGIGSR